ncbi:MAG: hypothetical protein ACREMZ_07050 [Gemmatimonadales bacterium]
MTHTFKLARRMARFRALAAAPALLLAIACNSSDSTSPTPIPPFPDGVGDSQNPTDRSPDPGSSSASPTGIPFGPTSAWDGVELKAHTDLFTGSFAAVSPSHIVGRIATARASGERVILAMTGGHQRYLTSFGRGKEFDRKKWDARLWEFNTAAIKAAVAAGVADGTIIGADVMDEPHVHGHGDGNTWGPEGTMTKARVDSLCRSVKEMFPTAPVGVSHQHDAFEPDKSYQVCDFVISQYAARKGDVNAFREGGLALARRDGHAIAFSINILNGGVQASGDGRWKCLPGTTQGRGTYDPNCRMSAQQVRDWGLALGPAGCAMLMWRYDATFMSDPANQQAFKDVAAALAQAPGRSCRRS